MDVGGRWEVREVGWEVCIGWDGLGIVGNDEWVMGLGWNGLVGWFGEAGWGWH